MALELEKSHPENVTIDTNKTEALGGQRGSAWKWQRSVRSPGRSPDTVRLTCCPAIGAHPDVRCHVA